MPKFIQFYVAAIVVLVGIRPVFADELPLYELGVGIGGLITPHYLGAAQDHYLLAPIPYIIYRGKWLRADNSGIKTFLVDKKRFDLNISFSASLPVNSSDDKARHGMPDLDWILQIGPTLRYTAWRSHDGDKRLRLDLPVRAAFSTTGLNLDYQGLTVSPGIVYFSKIKNWNCTASYAAIFGNRRYHGYFYDVDPAFATAQRPQYRARAGYTASRFTLSATRRYGNWIIGGFVRYYSLLGAANEASPLVKKDGNLSAGFMLVWLFKQSKTTVTRDPEARF